MKTIKKLYFSSIYSYKALYPWGQLLQYISVKFVIPLLQIYFFVLIGRYAGGNMQNYIIIGNIVHIISLNAIMGITATIALDKAFGNITHVLVTPSKKIHIILARQLPNIVDGFLGGVVGLIYARFLFGVSFENVNMLFLLVVLFLISVALSCFGLIFANLALIFRDVSSISNISYLFLLFVSGVNFPVSKLPVFLQKISVMTPLFHGIEAVRMITNCQISRDTYWNILITLALGLLYFIIGIASFIYIEQVARKRATLDLI